jgi:uncharacterized RDD family membrane protein YckC
VVKCPKCGFFSYPGLTRCKRCGASLGPTARPPSMATTALPTAQPVRARQGEDPPPDKRPEIMSDNLDLGFLPDRGERPAAAATPAQVQEPVPWRQELSERLLSFRQRRARLRNEPPQEENLDFEFERGETNAPVAPEVEKFPEFPQNTVSIDAEIGPRTTPENEVRYSDEEAQERDDEGFRIFDSGQPLREELAVEVPSPAENRLEIIVGPAEAGAPAAASPKELEAFPVAPLGRRFLAGLVDGMVLLLGGCVFSLIFWTTGGHLTLFPPNLAIVAVIVFIFVWSYFGFFTALTYSTPGQTWMGIEVRTTEGWPPASRESFLRAFGYLVSLSAFMIGFLWALVDSDSLTWHDRISGTFLTPVKEKAPTEGGELKV